MRVSRTALSPLCASCAGPVRSLGLLRSLKPVVAGRSCSAIFGRRYETTLATYKPRTDGLDPQLGRYRKLSARTADSQGRNQRFHIHVVSFRPLLKGSTSILADGCSLNDELRPTFTFSPSEIARVPSSSFHATRPCRNG